MKRFFSKLVMLALIACMCFSPLALGACDGGGGGQNRANKIIYWGDQQDQAILDEMVQEFKLLNPTLTQNITFEFGAVGEDVAKDTILRDPNAAADVFAFSDDQLNGLVSANALFAVEAPAVDAQIKASVTDVKARNTAASVAAASINSQLYAFPSSAESYLLFYDKSIYTAVANVESFENMFTIASAAQVDPVSYAVGGGYYDPMFFFAAGCNIFGADGKVAGSVDINSANGKLAAEYIMTLKSKNVQNYTDAQALAAFAMNAGSVAGHRKLAAHISGTWFYTAAKQALGNNLGYIKLPKVNLGGALGSKDLVPFKGHKLYGVNSRTVSGDKAVLAVKLADWFTSASSQTIRLDARQYVPTNSALLTSGFGANAVAEVDYQCYLNAKNKPGIANSAGFWTPMGTLGGALFSQDGQITSSNLQAQLDSFNAELAAL